MSDKPPGPPARPTVACSKCGKPMLMVHNLDTGKDGPADTRTTVYVIRRGADKDGKPLAMTAKMFLERLASVTLTIEADESSGAGPQQVTYTREDFEGFFVSHWNTCPCAAEFKAQKGRGK